MSQLLLNNVTKSINGRLILESLNCKLGNTITGIIGLNGSGKSTLLRIVSGLLKPDCGTMLFNGINCDGNSAMWRKRIGYLSQAPNLYERMSVYSFLDYMLILSNWRDIKKRTNRIHEICSSLKLLPFLSKNISTLSGGIKQKIAIAQSVIHDPPILLLDEPTNNLDNDERENFHKFLMNLADKKLVLIVEHVLDELPVICERVIVLKNGHFIFDGTPSGLIERNQNNLIEIKIPKENHNPNELHLGMVSFHTFNGSIVIRFDSRLSEIKNGHQVAPSFSEAVRLIYNTSEI